MLHTFAFPNRLDVANQNVMMCLDGKHLSILNDREPKAAKMQARTSGFSFYSMSCITLHLFFSWLFFTGWRLKNISKKKKKNQRLIWKSVKLAVAKMQDLYLNKYQSLQKAVSKCHWCRTSAWIRTQLVVQLIHWHRLKWRGCNSKEQGRGKRNLINWGLTEFFFLSFLNEKMVFAVSWHLQHLPFCLLPFPESGCKNLKNKPLVTQSLQPFVMSLICDIDRS